MCTTPNLTSRLNSFADSSVDVYCAGFTRFFRSINPFIDCILFGGNFTRVRDEEILFLNKFLFALLKFEGVVSLKILRDEGKKLNLAESYLARL